MQFETKETPDSPDHVALFIESLQDCSKPEDTTASKIIGKLESWDILSYQQLMAAGHLKKIEGEMHEVRVKVKSNCYRFFGYIKDGTVYMVHAIKKKTRKLTRKDIRLAVERIETIKKYENRRNKK
jgi:phage-related protein